MHRSSINADTVLCISLLGRICQGMTSQISSMELQVRRFDVDDGAELTLPSFTRRQLRLGRRLDIPTFRAWRVVSMWLGFTK